jgi:hypothetical protein
MGMDKSLAAYQGLLVPDDRIAWTAYDSANSVNTQAGPRPAAPQADQVSALSWDATGASDGTSYDLRVQVGGCPGRDDATWLWRPTGAGATQWRGWDPPLALSGWSVVDGDTTADAYHYPCALRLSDGTVLCVAQHLNTTVRVWRLPSDGSSAASVDVYTKSSAYSDGAHPCLVELPDGRVLLFFLLEVGTDSQIRMYYSDDSGATWTMGQRSSLREAIDRTVYDVVRMRAARVGSELLLVISAVDASLTHEDILLQYASQDVGASWSLIESWTGDTYQSSGTMAEVVAVDDTFVVAYLRAVDAGPGAADAIPCVRRIGSAWSPLSAAADIVARGTSTAPIWGILSAGNFTSATRAAQGLTVCADDDGTLYILGRDTAADYEGLVVRSVDGGVTWTDIGKSSAPSGHGVWWQAGAADGHPKALAAAMQGGRLLLFYQPTSSLYNDESLFLAQLGGYTDVELPRYDAGVRPTERVTWGLVYWPTDLPDAVGTAWTASHGGPPTIDVLSGLLDITQGVGQFSTWYTNPTADIEDGVIAEVDLHAASGTARVQVEVSDGTYGHGIRVSVTSTQVVIRDTSSGDIATVSLTSDETSFVSVRIALSNPSGVGSSNNGYAKVWKRPGGFKGVVADRNWDLVVSSTTVTSGSFLANKVSFGGATGTAHLTYGPVRVSAGGSEVGLGMVGQDNPDDLQGRALGASPVELLDGLFLQGVAGPGFRGHTWTMAPAYDYGVELVHHEVSRSPRRGWRTVDNVADAEIRWQLGTENELPQGTILGIYLGGVNWRLAYLDGLSAGGIYTPIATLSTIFGSSLKFERYGNTVRPNASTGNNGGWLPENGCVGWTWRQLAGANTVYRKVVSNTGGAWGPGSQRPPYLQIDGTDAGDDATGTTGELLSNQVLVLIQDPGQYTHLRLRVPAQNTAEGYRETGICLIGHMHLWGRSPSWGRELGWETTTEVTTARTGVRRVRAPSPVRRHVSFSWDEPDDTSELFASSPSPSWGVGYTGGAGAATPADNVLGMGGLFARLQGSKVPVVYCPRIVPAASASADITITHPSLLLYGAVTSTSYLATQSFGDECADPGEMLRGGRVTVEEEL